jgi:hypothetical protein
MVEQCRRVTTYCISLIRFLFDYTYDMPVGVVLGRNCTYELTFNYNCAVQAVEIQLVYAPKIIGMEVDVCRVQCDRRLTILTNELVNHR